MRSITNIAAALLVAGCAGANVAGDGLQTITDLRVLDLESRTQIVMVVERKLDYTYFSLEDPPRLVINLLNTSPGLYTDRIEVQKGSVLSIDIHSKRNPHVASRVEIVLTRLVVPEVRADQNRLVIELPKSKADEVGRVVEQYRIGPEDQLEVQVWKNADLTRQVTVRPDGKISLPLVGDVQASGLTTDELEQEIVTRLSKFIEAPHVSILVSAVNSYYYYITGEISKPGKYPLKGRTSLLQAVSMAGGFTPFASRNDISVFRKNPNGATEKRIRVRYNDILKSADGKANILLQTGDTIVIP